MQHLKSLWKKTKTRFDSLEKELVDCYIVFLREVAKYYLQQGRRVFFRENNVVHWGEGNFGWLVIEGKEETDEVFGEYISEIKFEPKINEKTIKGYTEIKEDNLEDIRYEIRE
ncbi:MAG: hypothetical protein Q8N12_02780 [Thermodesulfovibrionales bacterium]|nr:hypothetical protein [Nitrospinota bacterium]MCG2709950.1 hypothetical protein [Thermodesulfovibrionales bacterium]MDP3048341.1 hypothetical protein [Thermodesulfovibrionales bacterium]